MGTQEAIIGVVEIDETRAVKAGWKAQWCCPELFVDSRPQDRYKLRSKRATDLSTFESMVKPSSGPLISTTCQSTSVQMARKVSSSRPRLDGNEGSWVPSAGLSTTGMAFSSNTMISVSLS